MANLPYRKDLKIQKNILFGTELEVAGFEILKQYLNNSFKKLNLKHHIDTNYESHKGGKYDDWMFTHDASITQNQKGVEVISPISVLIPQFLDELYKICQFLKEYDGYINDSCSNHIHIDFRIFHKNLDALKKFILIISYYEAELERFFAGEKMEIRNIARICYAKSITRILYQMDERFNLFMINNWETFLNQIKKLDRNYALNFMHVSSLRILSRNSIELRSPNDSLNPIILENNIYTFLKIAEYCLLDSDWYSLYQAWKYEALDERREPEIKKARTLSRTIFQNTEDLKYFDWQYHKDF